MTPQEMKAVAREMEYDEEMASTAAGRKAQRVLQDARDQELSGNLESALSLRREALSYFSDDDDGAAASSARHDLAHSLTLGAALSDWTAINSAIGLLRRALSSPSRQASFMRRAQSENSLAVCLRTLARLLPDEDAIPILKEIEQLYRSVISHTARCGRVGSRLLAEAHLNLGNLLSEAGSINKAVLEYEHAISGAYKAMRDKNGPMQHVIARARLGTAEALLARGRKNDLPAAETQAREAVKEPEPGREDIGWILLAEISMSGTAPERLALAREHLRKVRPTRLESAPWRIRHAKALRRAGAPDEALGVLKDWIDRSIEARAQTIADFAADVAAMEFKSAAALGARILAQDKADGVGAFLYLENASGMRFAENLSAYAWRPRDPLAAKLSRELKLHTHRAAVYDGCARSLERMALTAQREILRDTLKKSRELPHEEQSGFPDKEHWVRTLSAALAAQVPLHYLQAEVEAHGERSIRLKSALLRHDPHYAQVHRVLAREVEREDLEAILRSAPEQVLIRFSLELGDLLAVAVWMDEEQLVARSVSLQVKPELRRLLRAVSRGRKKVEFDRASQLLAQLDLGPILPAGRRRRAVLLPSHSAAALPLAALGPEGNRLMDRFNSLVWLAGLLPLRIRPAACPPRSGHGVFDPRSTGFSNIALSQSLAGERRFVGHEAQANALVQTVAQAETICIYTHGKHETGEMPSLQLWNEEWLDTSVLMGHVVGLERMEIWACQTGTNRATDSLTPPADEAFGLDFLLLLAGARTCVGTLWPVPDLVTAAIVRRYRNGLSEGRDPAVALLEAQRWWSSDGVELLIEQLRHKPQAQAIKDFAGLLGLDLGPEGLASTFDLLGTTASVDSGGERIRRVFGCPVSWAAIRFVGLPEWKPAEPWSEHSERPLTDSEQAVITSCLSLEPIVRPDSYREQQEPMLAQAAMLNLGDIPSGEQALRVSRLLRDSLQGAFRNNVLQALAWLHEVLAAPGVGTADRIRLSVEAAHLWLEVAIQELRLPPIPHPVALARAELLLADVQRLGGETNADGLAASARLRLLRTVYTAERVDEAFRDALALLMPKLDGLHPVSFEALRVVTIAVELLPRDEGIPASWRDEVLRHAQAIASWAECPREMVPAWHRLRVALHPWEPGTKASEVARLPLTPRERTGVTLHALRNEASRSNPSSVPSAVLLTQALGGMEASLWGTSGDKRHALVVTVGTLGVAYRMLLKFYLSSHEVNRPGSEVHLLACLHSASDLRLAFLGRMAWLSTGPSEQWTRTMRRLHEYIRRRQTLSAALSNAVLLAEPASIQKRIQPHPLDPHSLTRQAMKTSPRGSSGLTAWCLELLISQRQEQVRPACTAAFEAIRTLSLLEDGANRMWDEILEIDATRRLLSGAQASRGLPAALDPGLDLESNERRLGSLKEGFGLLGLTLTPDETLLIIAWWNDGGGPRGRTLRLPAEAVRAALGDLLGTSSEDTTSRRGVSGDRRDAWRRLEAALAPALASLLDEAQSGLRLRWRVFAPGALRALPLLGIRLGRGELLAEQVEGLFHVPSEGFGRLGAPQPSGEDFTACLLAPAGTTTCFGEAALTTLHGGKPPEQFIQAPRNPASSAFELDALQAHASRISALRIYGVGRPESINDATAMFRLSDGRSLVEGNLVDLLMPHCRVVELWASTAGGADRERLLFDHEDRIPGLAPSFLAAGAAAVIDLAWPVHDVIKALVCEQYGWRSQRSGHGSEMLAEALEAVAGMLRALRSRAGLVTAHDVLVALDDLRRTQVQEALKRPVAITPFAAHSNVPEVAGSSGAELLDELGQGVHLGAFRWWGA